MRPFDWRGAIVATVAREAGAKVGAAAIEISAWSSATLQLARYRDQVSSDLVLLHRDRLRIVPKSTADAAHVARKIAEPGRLIPVRKVVPTAIVKAAQIHALALRSSTGNRSASRLR